MLMIKMKLTSYSSLMKSQFCRLSSIRWMNVKRTFNLSMIKSVAGPAESEKNSSNRLTNPCAPKKLKKFSRALEPKSSLFQSYSRISLIWLTANLIKLLLKSKEVERLLSRYWLTLSLISWTRSTKLRTRELGQRATCRMVTNTSDQRTPLGSKTKTHKN